MQGFPIGNGDLGAMLWTSGSQINLTVNKVDTWDDGPDGDFQNWDDPAAEDKQTTLRGCGKIVLDFGLPFWDVRYLKEFRGGLRLSDATAHLSAESPFGTTELDAYVSQEFQTLVVRGRTISREPIRQSVLLERFGSRSFGHWFSVVNRDAELGLSGTQTSVENERIIIRQQLRTLSFVVAMAVVMDSPACSESPKLLHSRAAKCAFGAATAIGFTVFLSVATSENVEDPHYEVNRRLDAAIAAGEQKIAENHAKTWREFWSRSYVGIPDSYLANIWHLSLYLAGSSSRGASPPQFCRGLWGTNHDFVPWYFIFHWNTQWSLLPLDAADHSELAEPYLQFRSEQLCKAINYAKNHGFPGALFVDVSERRGYQDLETNGNHTPGLQIAMDFWRHYQFTGDKKFLNEQAYPLMREVGKWCLGTLRIGEDGIYHPTPGTVYESFTVMEDAITDLAMLRSFLPALAAAAEILHTDEFRPEELREIVSRLADFHLVDLEPDEVLRQDCKLSPPGGQAKVFAVGYDAKFQGWRRSRIAEYYGIPDAEFAPVYPAGILGLKDEGTDEFAAALTQIRIHPFGEHASGAHGGLQKGEIVGCQWCMGWCPVPIVAARLGLKEEMVALLHDHVKSWQIYPQGFGHYGPYAFNQRDKHNYYHTYKVRDASNPDKTFPLSGWDFRHFSNEAMPIVASAISEMLLQCHEGIIRLCPAVPHDWEVAFTLVARGGFKISTEKQNGRIEWVWIESRLGNDIAMESPWSGASRLYVWRSDLRGQAMPESPRILQVEIGSPVTFSTSCGACYLVGVDPELVSGWTEEEIPAETNMSPKMLEPAILGKERQF
ncbi:glycoside hydrolase family 95 protein [soil metagenome]